MSAVVRTTDRFPVSDQANAGHWHQPLTLNLDGETMGDWFGLPKDADLPSTYTIDYVRAWRHS